MKASPACRGWKTPEWQKQLLRDKFSGKPLSEATKEKLRAAWVRRRAEGTDTWESTPEQRAKLSAAMKGKTVPADTRAKISAALKGRSLSAETRAKMSANRKGRKLSDAHRLALSGRPCSPETKAKISAKKRERDAAQRAMAAA